MFDFFAFMLLHNFCLILFILLMLVLFCFGARKFKKKEKGRALTWADSRPSAPAPLPSPLMPEWAAAQPRQPSSSTTPSAPARLPPAATDGWAPPVRVAPYLRPKRIRRNGRLRLTCRARIEDPRTVPAYLKAAAPVRDPPKTLAQSRAAKTPSEARSAAAESPRPAAAANRLVPPSFGSR